MRYQAKVVAVVGVGLLVVCTRGAGAPLPSADVVLEKSLESYDAAKTFQGEIKFAKLASTGSGSVSMRIKAENGLNGMIVRSSLTIVSTVPGGPGGSVQSQQIFDDGTTLFVVDPDRKQYATGPHAPDRVSGLFRRSLTNVQRIGGRFSIEVRQVNSRPTYVLSSRVADGYAKILIDKATLHLQSVHAERGKASARIVSDVTVSNQVFNERIPADVFVWEAPAGFTKAVPGGAGSP